MATDSALRKVLFNSADSARQVLLRHFGKITSIDRKGDIGNLVTIADRKAEAAIIRLIRKHFPDHAILAEESGATCAPDSEYRWVIDPLDGTTNYAHSMPIYAISIALQKREETIMGLVVDPSRDEWFFARKGGGAFLNRRRIRVSPVAKLRDSLILTGFPHGGRDHTDHFMKILGDVLQHSHGVVRLGAAALDLCAVACGRAEAFWEENLQPWDVAAGNLIVEEACGRTTNFQRKRSGIFDADLVASNGGIHGELLRRIRKNWKEWRAS